MVVMSRHAVINNIVWYDAQHITAVCDQLCAASLPTGFGAKCAESPTILSLPEQEKTSKTENKLATPRLATKTIFVAVVGSRISFTQGQARDHKNYEPHDRKI